MLDTRPRSPPVPLQQMASGSQYHIPKNFFPQESPPAWTQEAYRPRRIKYSICCPVLGGGGRGGCYPITVGYPSSSTPSLPGVTPPQVPPIRGTFLSDLAGVTPPLSDLAGVPPPPLHWTWPAYPPVWTWPGYPPPPWSDLARVPPSPLNLAGVPASPPGQVGYPHPPVDRRMDGQTRVKTYIPSYYVRGW